MPVGNAHFGRASGAGRRNHACNYEGKQIDLTQIRAARARIKKTAKKTIERRDAKRAEERLRSKNRRSKLKEYARKE